MRDEPKEQGRIQGEGAGGAHPPRPPEMTYGFLIQLVFCQKKNYVVYPGAEVEQQTSAPPPKKNPGFAPVGDHDLNSHIIKALTDFQC